MNSLAEKGVGRNPPNFLCWFLAESGELDAGGSHRNPPLGNPGLGKHMSVCPFFLRFKRLVDEQSNYMLMFLSATRWMSLRLELMTNLLTLVVALLTIFNISSVPYAYKAMAISIVLQVRKGLSDGGAGG